MMDAEALDANRRGQLTDAQRARFKRTFWQIRLGGLLFAGVLGVLAYELRTQIASAWPFLLGLGVFLAAIYYVLMYRLSAKGLADIAEGRVATLGGNARVWRDRRTGGARIHLDGKVLYLSGTNAQGWKLLRSGSRMRFHFLPRSQYVVSFEPMR